MATISEMFVEIGADASQFERETQNMQQQMQSMQSGMRDMARDMGSSTSQLTSSWQHMSNEMRNAYRSQMEVMRPFRQQQEEVRYGFFQMAQGMQTYSGTTREFMGDLQAMGNRQRQVNDAMMAADRMRLSGFIQGVATMLARSAASDKIAANFSRMGNPLYTVNNGLLRITAGLEGIARRGAPAVLALEMLGPTANMKQLADMTRLITQGLMRFQAVALTAAIASGILYTQLFQAAKGPDPSKVYEQQAEALAVYTEAVQSRTKEIMEAWNLFEKVQLEKTSGKQLIANLTGQVNTLKTWRTNLTNIAARAGDEFAQYLADMGPKAAGEVAAINKMSQPQLDKYVALWKEKMAQSKAQAVSELEGLKIETQKKIKELQDSLTPLGLALEPMKQAWAGAFKPMVDAFTAVSVPIVNFLTKIGEMINKFNEAHPTLAKLIQGILMLIPALTLILSPLAVGIGLFMGMRAAFASVWMLIGPLITGLGAMMGTVLIVAAALVVLTMGLTHLWKTNEGFRNGVISAWNAIKNAAISIWNFIYTGAILPAINAIMAFVKVKLEELRAFWAQNGAQIMQAVKNYWGFIQAYIKVVMTVVMAVMKVLWPVIKALIISTWDAIKNTISGAIKVITGIIKFFSALFTGDWKGLWEATKQILSGAVQLIWGLINLWFVGRFIAGFKAFAAAGRALFTSFWTTIKSIFTGAFNAVANTTRTATNSIMVVIRTVFTSIQTVITTILNAIRSVVTAVWNGIRLATVNAVNGIRVVISTVFNAIRSIISSILNAYIAIFRSIFNGIKSIVRAGVEGWKTTIRNGLQSAVDFIKGLGSTFKAAGKGLIEMMAAGISAAAGKVMSKVKELAGKVRDMLPFSPAKEGPLSDLDRLDFGGPIADSLKRGMPTVQGLMHKMLEMPDIMTPSMPQTMPTYSAQALSKEKAQQQVIVELDGRVLARGTLPHMEREVRLKTGLRFN